MQIVVLDGRSVDPGDLDWSPLREMGILSVYDRTPAELAARRLIGADVVLTRGVYIGQEELLRAKNLKLIINMAGEGTLVDEMAAKEASVRVISTGAGIAEDVAQHVMAMLLEITNSPAHYDLAVHRGRWTASADFCFVDTRLLSLRGMTMGVLGCGATGNAVARVAEAFGMRVIGHDLAPSKDFSGEFVPLGQLFQESDVLSLHCGVNPETSGIICRESIAAMKRGAILINAADGKLVCEDDVRQALERGDLYAFATDVASEEPLPKSSSLLEAPNCIITPHIGWASQKTRQDMICAAAQCIKELN